MLPERIPQEDLDKLEELTSSENWNIIVKYLSYLHAGIERKFLDSKELDMLLYEKGTVEGSRQLLNLVKDLKKVIRTKYLK